MPIPGICFAFRVRAIRPERDGGWEGQRPAGDFRPPFEWVQAGSETQWYGWDSSTTGGSRVWSLQPEEEVVRERVMSIVWSPHVQNYFITPHDCTQADIQQLMHHEPMKDWNTLYFHYRRYSDPGSYKILNHGTELLLPFPQPQALAGFLPRNFFREVKEEDTDEVDEEGFDSEDREGGDQGGEETDEIPCHLVGDLSLILALFAIRLSNLIDIGDYIDQHFCQGNEPLFIPGQECQRWMARNRFVYPTPALIMEVGLLADDEIDRNRDVLEDWEEGRLVPMVSSHPWPNATVA